MKPRPEGCAADVERYGFRKIESSVTEQLRAKSKVEIVEISEEIGVKAARALEYIAAI
jgi:hypothetical protein